ncbi:hypothetical protein SDC9_202373 [bioreactor metagenome]|uniref:Uncharacterized protein n=1 Tax=bioreactor metagenome TaxID=1076179 RepID=A0A645IU58_9ZZZZ
MAIDFRVKTLNVSGYDTLHDDFDKTITCIKPDGAIFFHVEFEKDGDSSSYNFLLELEYFDVYEYTYTQVINVQCDISKDKDGGVYIENKHLYHNFPQRSSYL